MLAFDDHNHDHCITGAVAAVEARCAELGINFTAIRRRVLEILLQEHRAMGAYDVLARLNKDGLGSQPPVAYRALDFLVTHGFAHRIERLNAFVACGDPGCDHAPTFLICKSCKSVAEVASRQMRSALSEVAGKSGFAVETSIVELEGTCPKCAPEPAAETTQA